MKKGLIKQLSEDITDADYMHVNRVYKNFEIKNIGEYHDSHLKSKT